MARTRGMRIPKELTSLGLGLSDFGYGPFQKPIDGHFSVNPYAPIFVDVNIRHMVDNLVYPLEDFIDSEIEGFCFGDDF